MGSFELVNMTGQRKQQLTCQYQTWQGSEQQNTHARASMNHLRNQRVVVVTWGEKQKSE